MKSRSEKMIEYRNSYEHIPKDYKERLLWLYDELKIDDALSDQIIQMRDSLISSTYYTTISMKVVHLHNTYKSTHRKHEIIKTM